jgi:hypothetical protein
LGGEFQCTIQALTATAALGFRQPGGFRAVFVTMKRNSLTSSWFTAIAVASNCLRSQKGRAKAEMLSKGKLND